MKNETIAALLVVAILVSAGAGYLVGYSNQRTTTSTSVSVSTLSIVTSYTIQQTATSVLTTTKTATIFERPFTYYSSISSTGLQLQVWLNTTTILQGGALTVQIYLTNTLSRNISLSTAYSNANISVWNRYDFLCGLSGNLLWGTGFAIFRGHFSQANISSAGSPLTLAPLVAIPCPSMLEPITLVLYPLGDSAVAYYNGSIGVSSIVGHAQLNATTEYCVNLQNGGNECGSPNNSLFGYWNATVGSPMLPGNATVSSPYFHYFSPGQYTLVSEDLWNQTVYAYFTVGYSTAQASFPFDWPEFLTTYCSGGGTSGNGTSYSEPCFTNLFSEAYVFDCGNSSASESGCTQVVTSTLTPQSNYTINIRFPYVAQANEPAWANCFYSVKGFGSRYAYCISVGQGSFILSQQGAVTA